MSENLKVGDRVHVRAAEGDRSVLGRTFVVRKVNPKNVLADATDGGRGINYPAYALEAGDAPVLTRPFAQAATPVFFAVGEVVTLKRPMPGTPADLPYVVVKDSGADRVNVARLGGDASRYVRAPRAGVVCRDVAWLAAQLAVAASA